MHVRWYGKLIFVYMCYRKLWKKGILKGDSVIVIINYLHE